MIIDGVDLEYADNATIEKVKKMNEQVLCIPAGLSLENFERTVNERSVFLVRKHAEKNFAYRHIIPYCVVMAPYSKRILAYQRKGGNEKRLDGQWSIGIGGHVHPGDGEGFNAVINARDRECMEEIGIKPHKSFGEIYIALDSTEVDRVHLGFCQIITEWHGDFTASEEIPHWEMLTIPELRRKNLETWAVYVLDLLESDWGDLLDCSEKDPATSGELRFFFYR
jgi:predicted NUDIX family phosphoesterase